MPRKNLKNKPLVEAILEIRWVLPNQEEPSLPLDPHYRILLGRLSERVAGEYPSHEPLPTSTIPDQMAAHIVQHRFRASPGSWPLLQVGPGIFTINDTSSYTWSDFQPRCERAVTTLIDSYPAPHDFHLQQIILRYIDALSFDFTKDNALQFLHDKMKTTLALPNSLFDGVPVDCTPSGFKWEVSFPRKNSEGTVTLRFGSGRQHNQPVLLWETLVVSSVGSKIPKLPDEFSSWLISAHDITDDWFFKLIEGDLERRFSGE